MLSLRNIELNVVRATTTSDNLHSKWQEIGARKRKLRSSRLFILVWLKIQWNKSYYHSNKMSFCFKSGKTDNDSVGVSEAFYLTNDVLKFKLIGSKCTHHTNTYKICLYQSNDLRVCVCKIIMILICCTIFEWTEIKTYSVCHRIWNVCDRINATVHGHIADVY